MPKLPADAISPERPAKKAGFGVVSSLGLFVVQLIWFIPAAVIDWLFIGDPERYAVKHWLLFSWPAIGGLILGIIGQMTIRSKGERYTGLLGVILNASWVLLTAWLFFSGRNR